MAHPTTQPSRRSRPRGRRILIGLGTFLALFLLLGYCSSKEQQQPAATQPIAAVPTSPAAAPAPVAQPPATAPTSQAAARATTNTREQANEQSDDETNRDVVRRSTTSA